MRSGPIDDIYIFFENLMIFIYLNQAGGQFDIKLTLLYPYSTLLIIILNPKNNNNNNNKHFIFSRAYRQTIVRKKKKNP